MTKVEKIQLAFCLVAATPKNLAGCVAWIETNIAEIDGRRGTYSSLNVLVRVRISVAGVFPGV